MPNIPAPVDATKTAAWKALQDHHDELVSDGISLKEWFAEDADRVEKFSYDLNDLHFDLSKNLVTDETIKLLCDLASFFGDGIAIFLQRDQLLAGDIIQTGTDLKIVDQLFFHQRVLDLRPGDRPGIFHQITQQQPDLRAVGQPAGTNTGGKSIVGGHRSAHPLVISNCCPALPRGRP